MESTGARGTAGRGMRGAMRFAALGAAMMLAACTTNPVTGRSQIIPLMSVEQEAQAGAEAHPKILKAYGGAYGDDRVGAYVAQVTSRIAKGSDRPDLTYRVTVLDSPVVNAFALPGGYVYVTRGLLSLVNDEAELAGVLGHEIGHVDARHSAQRQSAALGASVLGAVLGAAVGSQAVNQVVGLGSQGFLAGYSRDQEYEADQIGVRYLARTGYDPYAEGDFLRTMGAQEELHAAISNRKYDPTRVDWLGSHPATQDRVAAAHQHARATGVSPGKGERNHNTYLKAIDGLLYGDSPEQGVVRNGTFIHPRLLFTFTAPPRFAITNTDSAVIVQGPDKTIAKFDTAAKSPGMEIGDYLVSGWAGNVKTAGLERFKVNGMPTASATTRVGEYNARLVAIEYAPGTVYRFLMGTLPQTGTRHEQALRDLVMSFRRISPEEAARVKPLRIRIVTVKAGDTAESLGRRMVFNDYQAERFRVLNGLAADEQPKPGSLVKLIGE